MQPYSFLLFSSLFSDLYPHRFLIFKRFGFVPQNKPKTGYTKVRTYEEITREQLFLIVPPKQSLLSHWDEVSL